MLSNFQKRKLIKLFNQHDLSKNGQIEAADFQALTDQMAALAGVSKDSHQYQMMKQGFDQQWKGLLAADKNGNGVVSYEEWWAYWDHIINSENYEKATRPIAENGFAFLHPDAHGKVTKDSYLKVSSAHIGNPKESEEIFAHLSDNGRDLDFNTYMKRMDEFFKSSDPNAKGNMFFGRF